MPEQKDKVFDNSDMADFAEWMSINTTRYSSTYWKWRGDLYKQKWTTREMISHFLKDPAARKSH